MAGIDIDNLPTEIFLKLFSFLDHDLGTFRNVRLVSKKWKSLVIDAHPEFHFVVPLTDKTLAATRNLTETQVSLYVHGFKGKGNENEVASATTGTGLLFGLAERIKFKGDNIEPAEIQKWLPYAVATVRVLSFKILANDIIMRPFLEMTVTFSALRKLEIETGDDNYWGHSPGSGFQNMFECYTSVLQRLAALDSGPQLPFLESLKLSYNPSAILIIRTKEMFPNILAVFKLIVKFRRTLKTLDVDFRGVCDSMGRGNQQLALTQVQQTEMQECLDAFSDIVNLNQIRLSSVKFRANPLDWELQLLRRLRNLTELLVPNIGSDFGVGTIPDFARFLPENGQMLSTIKISTTTSRNDGPVNLTAFAQYPNLTTLWLELYQIDSREPLRVINVDQICKRMISLHFKSDRMEDNRWYRQHVILTREQMHWIVDNLQHLKSFWAQLVVQTPDNPNPGANTNNNANVNVFRDPQDEGEANSPSNIDVELFRDIMNMPNINDLKFDMMKASNLAEMIPIEEIREFSGMYKFVPSITTTCLTFPAHNNAVHPFAYTELSIQID